jgi:peptidoglycan/LPS O-acetylase OafA/YrhL
MNKRLPVLDLLRCLAIILVMFRHYDIIPLLLKGGWIGVDLFFVLSGFLVSGLLFNEYKQRGSINPALFFIRRGFKIYPCFWAILLIYIAYYHYKHITFSLKQVFAELFFVQNFTPGLTGITWSLAVEEHFYLILVLLTLLAIRKHWILDQKKIVTCCLCISIICLSLRTYLTYSRPFNAYVQFFPTYLRLDTLFAGVLVSWFYHFRYDTFSMFFKKFRLILLLYVLAGLQLPFLLNIGDPFLNSTGLTILYSSLAIGLCILLTSSLNWSHPVLRPAIFIGKYSYPIYLVHLLIGPAVANLFRQRLFPGAPQWNFGIICMLSAISSGMMLSVFIEQFFLKIRDRFFPKQPPLITASQEY